MSIKLRAFFVLAALLLSTAPAFANHVDSGTVSPSCNGYTITLSASGLVPGTTYTLQWRIDGLGTTAIENSISFTAPSSGTHNTGALPFSFATPLNGNFTPTGTVTLEGFNTIALSFSPSSLSCPTPPPPPMCEASSSNASNFNGTAISGGNYIWFNANFTASGVPSTGTTVKFTGSTINFTANGTAYHLPAPNAQITFSPSASCASTSFDSATNTFMTTVPVSGSDEIFLTGLSFPVPASFGTVQGNVTWTGTFGTNTPGVTMQWKWGAAVYTSPCFTTNYNAIAPLAAHGKSCIGNSGGDHAGTPEGTSSTTSQPFKQCVIGGARGGGGSNWTGSWSGTSSVRPVCRSTVSVNLSSSANVDGIATGGTPVLNGGLDLVGDAYYASQLGASLTWNGNEYSFGSPGTADAVSNATIPLPAGTHATLTLLGAAVHGGNQLSQVFTVHYSDGTSASFTQSLSGFGAGLQNYGGESQVLAMDNYVTANGSLGNGPVYLYGYSFPLDVTKTAMSLVLPANRDVVVLAVDLN